MSGIIDTHVHLYPDELNREPEAWAAIHGETHWATLCTRRRSSGRRVQDFPGVEDLLRTLDAAGIERAVLQGWYWEHAETCAWQNEFFLRCIRAHPDRLSAFATIHPQIGREALVQLVRRAHDDGFVGLGELSPHSQGYDVGDEAFLEALDLAGELRMPVNLHVTDHEGGRYPGRVETPLRDFLWLAHKYPHTNFILAHWGGRLPLHEEEAQEVLNLYYDTAASPLLYDETIWSRFTELVPVERVLFGSDYPLNLYPKHEDGPALSRLVSEARRNGVDPAALGVTTRRLLHLR
jgi:predicted TIM-barrel fold metal-dependent hydrolase